jgi:hypothetical protein
MISEWNRQKRLAGTWQQRDDIWFGKWKGKSVSQIINDAIC